MTEPHIIFAWLCRISAGERCDRSPNDVGGMTISPGGALALGIMWLAIPATISAAEGSDGWQYIGTNRAGASIWLHHPSIDRRSPVRAARLRLETAIDGKPMGVVIRSEYRCTTRQYRFNALLAERDGIVSDRMTFREGGIWKSWTGVPDQAAVGAIICEG